jgi:hypothetical protein
LAPYANRAAQFLQRSIQNVIQSVKSYAASSRSCSLPRETERITKEIIERKIPGADASQSKHIIERLGDETISVTHRVERAGELIHQHQRHIGRYGSERFFPDAWIEYPMIPPR